MISLEDYSSVTETLYLLKSPKNRERLLQSWQNVQAGKFVQKKLTDTE